MALLPAPLVTGAVYAAWRASWNQGGMCWWSSGRAPGWNPVAQLQQLED
jgi:hypothetical protein